MITGEENFNLLKEFTSLDILSENTKIVVEEWLLELEGINILNLFNGEHRDNLLKKVYSNDTDDRINLKTSIELTTLYNYFYRRNLDRVKDFMEIYTDNFKIIDDETYKVIFESITTDNDYKWYELILLIALIRKILK